MQYYAMIITVGFCILHDVLYDMGIMKPPLVLLYTGSVSFYCQDNGLLWPNYVLWYKNQ